MEHGFLCDRATSPPHVCPLGNFVAALHLEAEPGDLLEIDRKVYTQWGVYVGEGRLVYVAGEKADFPTHGVAKVRKSTLTAAAKGCLVRVNNKTVPGRERGLPGLPPPAVLHNARSQVGRTVEFNLFDKNSEHYATSWKFGQGWSDQADTAHKVMSMFNTRPPKRLPCSRNSAPGSLHAMVTGLAAIFHTGTRPPTRPASLPAGGTRSTGYSGTNGTNINKIRRQSSQ